MGPLSSEAVQAGRPAAARRSAERCAPSAVRGSSGTRTMTGTDARPLINVLLYILKLGTLRWIAAQCISEYLI